MIESSDNFWENATFMPHDDQKKIDQLLQRVYDKRQVEFVAFCLKVISSETALCIETGFLDKFNSFKNAEPAQRLRLIKHPLYNTWFRQTVRSQNDKNLLRKKLGEFGRVLEKITDDNQNSSDLLIEGERVSIKRFDVDSLILEASFPEYKLPEKDNKLVLNKK